MASTSSTAPPVLKIENLDGTLSDEILLVAFRIFLRNLDGKAKAAPEIKGRFERNLDFLLCCHSLYSIPESQATTFQPAKDQLVSLQREFLTCAPAQRIAVASQAALKKLSDHLRELEHSSADPKSAPIVPCPELTRPIYEDVHRKMTQKHDLWKKNYKPTMTLNALLCLLS